MNMRLTTFYGYGLDENGEPVKRTPSTNYDPFVLWGYKKVSGGSTAYSDRLWQEDHKKHDELCMKHFGDKSQHWASRDVEKIQAFLSDFIGKPVELLRIMQCCNQSSGYPYWRLDYKKIENEEGVEE